MRLWSSPAAAASPSPRTAPQPPRAAPITIQGFRFQPASLTVAPGAKVTVANKDTTAHTVTSLGTKAFDTGTIAGGRTITFTAPAARRSYAYVCDIHQYMHATLVVR